MIAILSLLASALPGFLLNGLHSYLQATTTQFVEGEKTKRQVMLASVQGIVTIRQAQASVIQEGMKHKAFWVPWLIAAVTATIWYAWGMVDSTIPGHLPHVAALPPQLKDYTDAIWNNLFLSGSIAVSGTAVAGAAVKIADAIRSTK